MAQVIKDIVTWLKQWFYTESEVDTLLNGKSSSNHTHGNLSNDGKISTTSSATMLYFCGVGASANTLYKSNKLSSDIIIDGTAHSSIGSSANENQSSINTKINNKLNGKSDNGHNHETINGGYLGINLVDDSDGANGYAMDNLLLYDYSDTGLLYYDKEFTGLADADNEIATKGDITDAVGSAITYINQ